MGLFSCKFGLSKNSFLQLLLRYMVSLLLCLAASIIIGPLWVKHAAVAHTIFELVCIFFALSTVTIIWYTFEANIISNQAIGVGFLAVAVFDFFHMYFWAGLGLFPKGYYGLSTWHWVMGRFTEAAAIMLMIVWFPRTRLNKWLVLIITLALSCGLSYLFLAYPGFFPVLQTQNGVTPLKVAIEYIIIALFIANAFLLANGLRNNDAALYRQILLAILLAIPGELCFTAYTTITSYFNALGHVLKVAYYYYLFKGIYASAIQYPYTRLKESKSQLENLNARLEGINRHYSDLLERLPVALVSFSSDKRLKFANSEALRILGYELEELKDMTIREVAGLMLEPGNQSTMEALAELPKEARPVKTMIAAIKNKQGRKLSLCYEIHTLQDQDIVVLFNEAKREQALENLQLQTQTILNCISNAISVMDKDNRIIIYNKAFEKFYEIEQHEMIGMDRDAFNELFQYSNKSVPHKVPFEEGQVYELSVMTRSKKVKELLVMPAPVFNIDGERIGCISVDTDITELKKDQKKIIQQEKLAIIGQMGASIVHETKNHLALIKGYCQILSLKISDDKLKSYIEKIEKISEDINKVVVEFLSLGKPSETHKGVVSVNRMIESVRYMLDSFSFMRGVKTQIELSDRDMMIMADEAQIKQVMLNMVKNAIEAMNGVEKPFLKVASRINGREAHILISDNGKGIDSMSLKELGKPFYTTKENGTGLGLSVCYHIVKDHGGRIEVQSEVARGTTFTIAIPCCMNDTRQSIECSDML